MPAPFRVTACANVPDIAPQAGATAHPQLLQRLHAAVGDDGLVLERSAQAPYLQDRLGRQPGRTPVVVRPLTTAQTAAVMRICHDTRTPVVPQGGHTGRGGGATPDASGAQVVLSLGRLNAVRRIDLAGHSLTVEAGMRLCDVHAAALRADHCLPLEAAALQLGTVGGKLASGADGLRQRVLGLEVVMPDGRIWHGLRARGAEAAGYDLRQLFIGSQGTLGIITAAVLRLGPRTPGDGPPPTGSRQADREEDAAPALEFELMLRIKQALDPNQLMNPGKFF